MTTILIKKKDTAGAPAPGDLTNAAGGAEIAVNTATKRLYTKDSGGTVVELGTNPSALTTNLLFSPDATYDIGASGATRPRNLFLSGAATLGTALATGSGGTGLASYTAGDLSYYASGTALTKLAIGTAGQILTSSGTAPQWSTLSGVAVTTFSAGTTGFTPSSATAGAITLAGTLNVANGGTGLTSLTAGRIPYGAGTSALGNSSSFIFDGTVFGVGAAPISTVRQYIRGTGATSATWALYIDNSTPANIFSVRDDGNVGIGLSSAAFKLQTSGAQNANDIVSTNSTTGASLRMQMIDAYGAMFTTTSYPLMLGTNSTERLRITTAGNVGIGVSAPASRLHVYGGTLTTLTLGNGTANDYSFLRAESYPQANNGYTIFSIQAFSSLVSTSVNVGNLGFTKEGAGTDNKAYFDISTHNGTSLSERLRITSAGNVGIGTSTPTQKLVVYEGGGTAYSIVETGTAGAYAIFLAKNPNNDLYLWNRGDNNTSLLVSTAWDMQIQTSAAKYISFATNGSERARFASDGKFSINTSSSGAYTQVNTLSGANVVAYRVFDEAHDGDSATYIYPITAYYARRDNNVRYTNPIVTNVSGVGATAVIAFTDRQGTGTYPTNVRTSDILFYTATNDYGGGIDANPRLTLQIYAEGTIQFNRYGAGTLSTNGSGVISASDGRMKTKTRDLTEGLSKIRALAKTTMYYLWNENTPMRSEHEEIGWAAQDVAAVIPEASPDPGQDKFRNYHDRAVIAYMAKAIDELAAQIESLKTA